MSGLPACQNHIWTALYLIRIKPVVRVHCVTIYIVHIFCQNCEILFPVVFKIVSPTEFYYRMILALSHVSHTLYYFPCAYYFVPIVTFWFCLKLVSNGIWFLKGYYALQNTSTGMIVDTNIDSFCIILGEFVVIRWEIYMHMHKMWPTRNNICYIVTSENNCHSQQLPRKRSCLLFKINKKLGNVIHHHFNYTYTGITELNGRHRGRKHWWFLMTPIILDGFL